MTRLSEQEKQELLEEAHSNSRKKDFSALSSKLNDRVLSPSEFVEFLNWAQPFMTEASKTRPPIQGDQFRL